MTITCLSELKMVDLTYFYFSFYFHFSFHLFSYFGLRIRISMILGSFTHTTYLIYPNTLNTYQAYNWIMKSKKPSYNKTFYDKPNNKKITWPPSPPTNKKTGQLPSQNMFQGSKALHNNISDISIVVDSPTMNTITNPSNNSFLFFH